MALILSGLLISSSIFLLNISLSKLLSWTIIAEPIVSKTLDAPVIRISYGLKCSPLGTTFDDVVGSLSDGIRMYRVRQYRREAVS